jgi:hypothetical protein
LFPFADQFAVNEENDFISGMMRTDEIAMVMK